ncbi:MAG: Gfo/Idh/MocA family protein [Acidimicrobiia bacterium]
MRIALIGCGHIGTVHSFALKQLLEVGEIEARVVTTYDPDTSRAERMAVPHGATAVAGIEEACDGADVAWICTWTAAHLPAVEAAVARGMPVFCEKPLAPTLADCERVAELLQTVPNQVGLVLRHAPVFANVAEIVASGRYGRPMAVTLRDDQYFPNQGMYGSTWRSEVAKAGGGALIEHSVHDVDVLRWILGDPEQVTARTASHFSHPGIEDAVNAGFAYGDGTVATLVSVWHQVMTRPSTRRLEVLLEEAFCWTEDDYLGPLHIETSAGTEVLVGEAPEYASRFRLPDVLATSLAAYAEPARAFLTALAGDGTDARGHPDVATALAAHRLVDAAYRSAAAGGEPIALQPGLLGAD